MLFKMSTFNIPGGIHEAIECSAQDTSCVASRECCLIRRSQLFHGEYQYRYGHRAHPGLGGVRHDSIDNAAEPHFQRGELCASGVVGHVGWRQCELP